MKYFSLAIALTFAAGSVMAESLPDPSKLPPASTREGLTYEKDIKPIFDATCIHCHGEKEAKHELRLDSLEGILKGAKDHKVVVVPGHSDKSKLVFEISDIDGKIAMPPKPRPPKPHPTANGETNAPPPPMAPPMHPWKPLTPEQVGLIRAWIDQGAKP